MMPLTQSALASLISSKCFSDPILYTDSNSEIFLSMWCCKPSDISDLNLPSVNIGALSPQVLHPQLQSFFLGCDSTSFGRWVC